MRTIGFRFARLLRNSSWSIAYSEVDVLFRICKTPSLLASDVWYNCSANQYRYKSKALQECYASFEQRCSDEMLDCVFTRRLSWLQQRRYVIARVIIYPASQSLFTFVDAMVAGVESYASGPSRVSCPWLACRIRGPKVEMLLFTQELHSYIHAHTHTHTLRDL